jgi:mono/diheme cytochrome c family protein
MRTCCLILFLSACTLPAQEKEIKRVPVEPTPMASGQQMFKAYCATCHGARGTGDGPVAAALKKAPTDLTQLARKHDGKFPRAYVAGLLKDVNEVAHGSNDMPVWGPLLSSVSYNSSEMELRIYNIVAYIESIQAK